MIGRGFENSPVKCVRLRQASGVVVIHRLPEQMVLMLGHGLSIDGSAEGVQPPLILSRRSADEVDDMAVEEPVDLELMLNRFRRLVGDLTRGVVARTTFQPWEVDILLDIETCQVERRRRLDTLRQYQRAVERQMAMGPGPPMKLSEFLQLKMTRRPSMP